MDPERKMEYYFFLEEKQKKIKEELDRGEPKKDTYKFVEDFDIEDGAISGPKTG